MNSTILSICVALAIIILSEGKYLLVSVEDSGVSRLQSRQSFNCEVTPAYFDDQNVLEGLDFEPDYTTDKKRISSCAPFDQAISEPRNGNYIAYEIIPRDGDKDNLNIVHMEHDICNEATLDCQCRGMLHSLFNHTRLEDGSNKKIHASVNEVTIPAPMVDVGNFVYICMCFLEKAKEFEFMNVNMPKGINKCLGTHAMNSRGAAQICGDYRHNKCYGKDIKIWKRYTGP